MATLQIWETVQASSRLPILRLDDRQTYQAVTFTGTPGQSAPFAVQTSVISIKPDVACAVRVGIDPTALVTDYPLEANKLVEFEVLPRQKISVIAV